jgi:type I restriction enzyme S subunit
MDSDNVAVTAPRSAALPRSLQGNLRVPSQWHITPLKVFLRVRSERQRPDLPLLSVYRDHGVVPFGSVEGNFNKPSLDLDGYRVVRVGDLVLNKMKTWQGSLAVSGLEGLVSPAYIVCRVGETWHGRFLHYLLRSHPYIAEYAALSYGVRPAQWDMRFEDFRLISALEPPLEQQRSIADFLDRETEKIDALVAKKEHLIELLQEKRTALISHVVTKGLDPDVTMKDSGAGWLGKLPGHWALSPLMRLVDPARPIMYGIVLPGPDFPGGVPIVKGGDVSLERLALPLLNRTDPAIEMRYVRSRLAGGDVVYAIRGSIGAAAVVPDALEGANLTQDTARVAPRAGVDVGWLMFALQSSPVFAQLEAGAVGATIRGINIFSLKRAVLPVPPQGEQVAIRQLLGLQTAKLDTLRESVLEAVVRLREYRSALITAAVTGQIDVREYAKEAS